jgi:hypothetical protein
MRLSGADFQPQGVEAVFGAILREGRAGPKALGDQWASP